MNKHEQILNNIKKNLFDVHKTNQKQSFRDLHLEDIEDGSEITTKLLVKRATDAIVFKEDDVKDTDWQFSYVPYSSMKILAENWVIDLNWIFRRYKTDSHEHEQKGVVRNGELSVVGAYSVKSPDGYTQTTMYVADKDGFRPQVQLRFADLNLLKSAIG